MKEKSGKVAKNAGNRWYTRDSRLFKSGQKVAKWPEKVAKCPFSLFRESSKSDAKVAKCPLFSPSAHFQNTKVAKKYNLELPKVGADLAAKMARILF